MGHSPVMPPSGAGGGALTPAAAKKFFEFFSAGTHREVVFLGDLVEQPVHFVRSKGHKVLCGARVGACKLCEIAGEDGDTSVQQTEFYAPSFVRNWREREFHQRVAVFSDAAGRQLLAVMGSAQLRGRRVEVSRRSQGTSPRFNIEAKEGNVNGWPAVMPPAFDLVPFIRARYGRAQTPDRPLVLLDSLRCEPAGATVPTRPRALSLSAEDCRPSDEMLNKLRNYTKARQAEAAKPDPTSAIPPATTTPAEPPVLVEVTASADPAERTPAPAARPELAKLRTRLAPPPAAAEEERPVLTGLGLGELGVIERAADPTAYGPRIAVVGGLNIDAELDSVSKLCADLKRTAPALNGTGKHHANGNGGGK